MLGKSKNTDEKILKHVDKIVDLLMKAEDTKEVEEKDQTKLTQTEMHTISELLDRLSGTEYKRVVYIFHNDTTGIEWVVDLTRKK